MQIEREELANSVTHGFGAVASVAAGSALMVLAVMKGNAWLAIGTAVFALSMVALYTISTLYHAVPAESAKSRLKVADHCAIYALIAGTYTPFMLGGVRGGLGWTLFGVIWGLAAAGVVFKLFFTGRFRRLSTAVYIAMGWLVVVAARPVAGALPGSVLVWLAVGGIAYTAGTAFYLNRRLPYSHAIWHLFVIAGSTSHVVALALLILAG
ncbi:MAG: hemolysin III family protein [marine benthic group bacterium]|nr:hemolysin III family protein [Gemmatimonadota bacterium]